MTTFDSTRVTFDEAGSFDGSVGNHAYRPSKLIVSCPKASGDGRYYGRYPNGDNPLFKNLLAAAALTSIAAAGNLTTAVSGILAGSATSHISAAANLAPVFKINSSGKFTLNGQPFNPRGASIYEAGYENGTTNLWDNTGWQGSPPVPDFALFRATWKGNIVRLSISAQCWLGQSCLKLSSIGMTYNASTQSFTLPNAVPSGAQYVNKDADGQYKPKLKYAVDWLTALGFVVILDMHYWSSDVVIGGKTYHVHNIGGSGQQPLPDANVTTAWAQIASAYSGYTNVCFGIANEPGSNQQITWSQWASGGTQSQLFYNDGTQMSGQYNALINYSWTMVGHHALATTIMNNAPNVILFMGTEYGAELGSNGFYDHSTDTLLSSMPSDTRPGPPQLAFDVHLYPQEGSQPGDANYYRLYTADYNVSSQGYRQWYAWAEALIVAGIPGIATEYGGFNGAQYTTPDALCNDVQSSIDTLNSTHGDGSFGGVFWAFDPNGTDSVIDYSSGVIQPNGGGGQAIYPWISGHAAP